MTLESTINKNRYIGNGATTQFPFSFKVWKPDQVLVFVGDGTAEQDVSAQCTIDLSASGGTVTFSTAPASGTVIVLRRSMPYIQEDDYRNGSRFDSEEVEERFDMDCAERQDLRLDIGRAVKVPETSGKTPEAWWAEAVGLIESAEEAKDLVWSWLQAIGTEAAGTQTPVLASGTTAFRTLGVRFGDFVSVKDFGAKGDGAASDQEAFDAAVASGAASIFIPDGTYIINGVFIDRPIHIYASNGAVIKRETWDRTYYADRGMHSSLLAGNPQARSGLLTLFSGASGSSVRGGTWDMNAWEHLDEYDVNDVKAIAELDPEYDFQCVFFTRSAHRLCIENVTLRGATSRALNIQNSDFSVFRNIRMLDSEGGFQISIGNYQTIENLYCERISNRKRTASDSEDWKTGQEYLITYQHNSVLRQNNYSNIRNIIFNGYAPLEGTGTEPNPCMLTLERVSHSNVSGIVMNGRVNVPDVISVGLSMIGCQHVKLSDLDIHDHVLSIDAEGCVDTNIDGFSIDNNWYTGSYDSSCMGIQIGNGAWAQHGNDSATDMFFSAQSKGVSVTNGTIRNAYVGVEHVASNSVFQNVHVSGCYVGWNLREVDEHGVHLDSLNNYFVNCSAKYCGKAGVQVNNQSDVVIDGMLLMGNGWDTTLEAVNRCGLYVGSDVNYAKVVDCRMCNEPPMTKDAGFSFAPAAPQVIEDGTNRYPYRFTFVSPDPTNYQVGQTVEAVGLYDGDTLYCHVLDVVYDAITVGWTQGVDTVEPLSSSIVALTGTVSASGKTVAGSGTAFTTEITGSTFVKIGTDYRLVAKVVSDTSLVLAAAVSQNWSGAGISAVLVRTFRANAFQQYGFVCRSQNAHSVFYKNNIEYNNNIAPMSVSENSAFCADSEFKKSSGTQSFSSSAATNKNLSVCSKYDVPKYWKFKIVEACSGLSSFLVRIQVGATYTTLAEGIGVTAGTVAGGAVPQNLAIDGTYYLQCVAKDGNGDTVSISAGAVYGYVAVNRYIPSECLS